MWFENELAFSIERIGENDMDHTDTQIKMNISERSSLPMIGDQVLCDWILA